MYIARLPSTRVPPGPLSQLFDCQCGGTGFDPRERCPWEVCIKEEVPKYQTMVNDCKIWTQRGLCKTHKPAMNRDCSVQCGRALACEDFHDNCKFWGSSGECDRNPGYMIQWCPKECNQCAAFADQRKRCLELFPDWRGRADPRLAAPRHYLAKIFEDAIANYSADKVTVRSRDPWVVEIDDFLTGAEGAEAMAALLMTEGAPKPTLATPAEPYPKRTASYRWCLNDCRKEAVNVELSKRAADLLGAPTVNHTESWHVLQFTHRQQVTLHHDFMDDERHKPGGPRLLALKVFLADVQNGGAVHSRAAKGRNFKSSYLGRFPLVSADSFVDERSSLGAISNVNVFLWNARPRNGHVEATLNHPCAAQVHFPAINVTVAPRKDAALLFALVRPDDLLKPDMRTQLQFTPLWEQDTTSQVLETWSHLHDYYSPHLNECLMRHASYLDINKD